MTYNRENRNPNAFDLFHDINKYLKCDQDNGAGTVEAMENCEICDTVLRFIFALEKEGWIK